MINRLKFVFILLAGLFHSCSGGGVDRNNHHSVNISVPAPNSIAIPNGPCSDPAFTQMDFWVGSWNGRSMVPDTTQESGWKIAKVQNTIFKILDGCVV